MKFLKKMMSGLWGWKIPHRKCDEITMPSIKEIIVAMVMSIALCYTLVESVEPTLLVLIWYCSIHCVLPPSTDFQLFCWRLVGIVAGLSGQPFGIAPFGITILLGDRNASLTMPIWWWDLLRHLFVLTRRVDKIMVISGHGFFQIQHMFVADACNFFRRCLTSVWETWVVNPEKGRLGIVDRVLSVLTMLTLVLIATTGLNSLAVVALLTTIFQNKCDCEGFTGRDAGVDLCDEQHCICFVNIRARAVTREPESLEKDSSPKSLSGECDGEDDGYFEWVESLQEDCTSTSEETSQDHCLSETEGEGERNHGRIGTDEMLDIALTDFFMGKKVAIKLKGYGLTTGRKFANEIHMEIRKLTSRWDKRPRVCVVEHGTRKIAKLTSKRGDYDIVIIVGSAADGLGFVTDVVYQMEHASRTDGFRNGDIKWKAMDARGRERILSDSLATGIPKAKMKELEIKLGLVGKNGNDIGNQPATQGKRALEAVPRLKPVNGTLKEGGKKEVTTVAGKYPDYVYKKGTLYATGEYGLIEFLMTECFGFWSTTKDSGNNDTERV